ncbi:MAG: phosphatase [Mycobacterium sp.]|nr:phosphatase [Mycobacterium sp.]
MTSYAVEGILFDNDGVLVDSHDAAAAAWNQWARTWAPDFDFHRDIQHGRRLADVVGDLVSPDRAEVATRDLLDMEMRYATDVPAIVGAAGLLRVIPPDSWVVVTSGAREMALARMSSADLPHPRAIVSAEDVRAGKPAPDPYLAGAAALGLKPVACAVFEDAPLGVMSARAAGAGVVIGVGPATIGCDVDVTVSTLSGITFDGTTLVVSDGVTIG